MIVQFGISAVFFAAGLAAMGFGFNPRLFGFGRFELALTPFLCIVGGGRLRRFVFVFAEYCTR